MSFLEIVVNDMVKETAQVTFVNKIHKETGVSVDKLNEVFHSGMSLMTNIDSDPVVVGKASVYKFLDELNGDKELEEGDVVPFRRKKKEPKKYCTCPYDPDDHSKDVGTDPDCKFHGTDSEKLKEDSASNMRWTRNVDHVVSMAMRNGYEPKDLQKKAERLERLGDEKAAIYFDAAQKYAKTDVFRKKSLRSESDEGAEQFYQIFDNQTKAPVSKKSTNVKRLRNRADTLDLKYGAIRYTVKPVESD